MCLDDSTTRGVPTGGMDYGAPGRRCGATGDWSHEARVSRVRLRACAPALPVPLAGLAVAPARRTRGPVGVSLSAPFLGTRCSGRDNLGGSAPCAIYNLHTALLNHKSPRGVWRVACGVAWRGASALELGSHWIERSTHAGPQCLAKSAHDLSVPAAAAGPLACACPPRHLSTSASVWADPAARRIPSPSTS